MVRLILPIFFGLVLGCTAHDPLPADQTSADSTLTEEEIRNIALDAAEESAEKTVARIQKEADERALEENERRKAATEEEARSTLEATAAAEEQAIIDAVQRSEEAYWLLVPSERMRVDTIR
jgi:hypothetical protein